MTEKAVLKVRPVVYAYGLIGVALVTLLMSWLMGFTNSGFVMDWNALPYDTVNYVQIMFVFFFTWIIALIAQLLGGRFNRAEILVMTSMIYVSWLFPTWYGGIPGFLTWGGVMKLDTLDQWYYELLEGTNRFYTPPIFKLETEVWKGFYEGGAAVPWSYWALPIAYGVFLFLSIYMLWFFAGALIRRELVDVEREPFPLAQGNVTLIKMSEQKILLKNKYLWIGILLGSIGLIQHWGPFYIPGMPVPQFIMPGWDFVYITVQSLPWVPISLGLGAFYIGAALLVPTTVLLSTIVFTFIFWWVIPPILYSVGVLGALGWGTYSTAINWFLLMGGSGMEQSIKLGEAGMTWYDIGLGAALVLVFFPMLVTYRKETIRALKAIVRGDKELDSKEPLSYRMMFLGLVGSFIGWFVMLSIGTGGVSSSYPFAIVAVIFIAGTIFLHAWVVGKFAGVFGLIGGQMAVGFGYPVRWQSEIRLGMSYLPPFGIENRNLRAQWLRGTIWGDIDYHTAPASPSPYSLEMYSAASTLNVNPRNIFIGMGIAIPVAVVLSFIFIPWLAYTYGFLNKWSRYALLGWCGVCQVGSVGMSGSAAAGVPPTVAMYQPLPSNYTRPLRGVTVGAIISVILFVLRARFPWFPLHPAGLALGIIGIQLHAFVPLIIAYVVKTIVIRVRGVEYFHEKVVPLAIGMVLSLSLWILITDFTRIAQVL